EDASILADGGHVSGMKPATAHRFRCGRRLLPVALHHTVGTSDNLPHGFSIAGNIVVLEVHDPKLHAWDRVPGHRPCRVKLSTIELLSRLQFGGGEHRRSFRQAVSGKTRAAKLFLGLAHQGWRRSISSDRNPLQTAHVVLLPVWRIHQCRCHDRHKTQRVDALLLDQLEDFRAGKALKHDMFPSDEGDGMGGTPTVGMEQWNGMQIYAIRLGHEGHNYRESVKINISV